MELRNVGGARLRRADRGRAGFVALAAALYLAAGVVATSPAIWHSGDRFLAGGAAGHGEAAPGDHLQTGYRLWLLGDQLEHGRAPWLDPYSFRPETGARVNPSAWPFGIPYWPLSAALARVWAWNAFVLLTFLAAGAAACAWLRELELPRGAALAGGLAFALAPYRVEQTVGHLIGPISLLLPLALFGFERARRRGASWHLLGIGALASIPLSGQVHVALGAIPFFAAYALARAGAFRASNTVLLRTLIGALAAVALAIGAGLLIRYTVIAGSISAGGRKLSDVSRYSATGLDFLTRHERHGPESFVFLGWLTPAAALAGLWLLRHRRGLALVLGLGAVIPILLALGTHLPVYAFLWHHFPPLRYPRVPERLMPVATLAIAALVAFAVAAVVRRRAALALLILALLFLDLRADLFEPTAAGSGGKAYADLPTGRLLELPIFLPGIHYGSVYLYFDMRARRQRPEGYSTTAPRAAEELATRLQPLNCGDWTQDRGGLFRSLGVGAVIFHRGLFVDNRYAPDAAWFAWRGLTAHGFRPLSSDGAVTSFVRGRTAAPPPVREPDRRRPFFCTGWYAPRGGGREMSLDHAPFWIYGRGNAQLVVGSWTPLPARISVDGRAVARRTLSERTSVVVPLGRAGWHLIVFDAHLPQRGAKPVGARIALQTKPLR